MPHVNTQAVPATTATTLTTTAIPPEDLTSNYLALALAILSSLRVEVALAKVNSDNPSKVRSASLITGLDITDMKKLRAEEGLTIRELAQIYDIGENTVSLFLKGYRTG